VSGTRTRTAPTGREALTEYFGELVSAFHRVTR
jgi:hypothetical protein